MGKIESPVESWASSAATRRSMQSNRSRDTALEMALRSMVHRKGLRYRVCQRPLPTVRRRADLVFRGARVAVEVHGCFWHGCPEHYRSPASNRSYWAAKVERNRERDSELAEMLAAAGWLLIVVWEHEDLGSASERIVKAVRQRTLSTPAEL